MSQVTSNVGAELSFQLPFAAAREFPAMFTHIDEHKCATPPPPPSRRVVAAINAPPPPPHAPHRLPPPCTAHVPTGHSPAPRHRRCRREQLHVDSYGVGVTTLEEVFLNVAKRGNKKQQELAKEASKRIRAESVASREGKTGEAPPAKQVCAAAQAHG